jgi:hypothetical protein
VAETTVKRLLFCGFRRICKAMGQMYRCWWRICREINVFPNSNIKCFTFYIYLKHIYWLSFILWQAEGLLASQRIFWSMELVVINIQSL